MSYMANLQTLILNITKVQKDINRMTMGIRNTCCIWPISKKKINLKYDEEWRERHMYVIVRNMIILSNLL